MSCRQYPKVWSKFERTVEDGRIFKFEIEDVPESMWRTAVEFMLGNYIREDVWWNAADKIQLKSNLFNIIESNSKNLTLQQGTAQDPEAIEEYRVLLSSIIRQQMSLACFLTEGDGSGRTLVAVNLCIIQQRDRFVDHNPPKTKAGLLSLRMFAEAAKVTALYDKYHVDKYLMGAGLSVTPEYRGLGIAVELLQCRLALTKELGEPATGGIFTSAPAQRSAEKAGYECLYQIPYKQFGKLCKIKFNSSTEYLKILGKKME